MFYHKGCRMALKKVHFSIPILCMLSSSFSTKKIFIKNIGNSTMLKELVNSLRISLVVFIGIVRQANNDIEMYMSLQHKDHRLL